MKKANMELCLARHTTPATDGAIFGTVLNPLDVEGLELEAEQALDGVTELILYVTGLTVALVAVVNVCRKNGIKLTLMHYDREADSYYPQPVL